MSSHDRPQLESLLRRSIENAGAGTGDIADIAACESFDVSLIGVNGARVDATVRSGDREWRVVFGTDDGESIEWISVFERPVVFEGRDGGCIVVINGPSGAGKSATMSALAALDTNPWIVFDEPHFGDVAQTYLIWRDTAPSIHRGFLDGIAALARAGNFVAVSAAGHPMAEFVRACAATRVVYVGLQCEVEVLLSRERGREGRWGGLAASSMSVHDGWAYDLELDSSRLSPNEIASAILELLDGQPTST